MELIRRLLLAGIPDFNSVSAQDHTPAALSRQPPIALVSKLVRNVPFLTSLKVSPFRVLLLSGSLALPGAQPCG